MNGAYYNEHDPFAAAWLRELIRAGAIPAGDVDERDIQTVQPSDLAGYAQCHFFAGIGGWAYALELAGWPTDRPVWTGSCPCQPYSAAGKGEGADDARNLWPHWFRLIRECRPATVFGEQVEAAIRHGWLDAVSTDLEAEGYAFGASVLGAHSVGAPHIRQRVFFVADRESRGRGVSGGAMEPGDVRHLDSGGEPCALADASHPDRRSGERGEEEGTRTNGERRRGSSSDGAPRLVANADRRGRSGPGLHLPERGPLAPVPDARGTGAASAVGHAEVERHEGRPLRGDGDAALRASQASPWSDLVWLPCRDGKARPTQSGIFPLAHGVPNRVGTLRGAGNAINPWTAAEVIGAFLSLASPVVSKPSTGEKGSK